MKTLTITYDSEFIAEPNGPDAYRLIHIGYNAETGAIRREVIADGLSEARAKEERRLLNRLAARCEREA